MLVENWLVEVVDTEVDLVPRTKKLQSTIAIIIYNIDLIIARSDSF